MQAVILAAGMGKRLKDLTQDATKCMVRVNGVTMIERMLTILDKKGLSRIVIVVGYEGQKLIDYVSTLGIRTPVEYVNNDIYYKTNNIYSLYLAREVLLAGDTLLLESDLVFEEAVIDRILEEEYPSLALVAKFESWMDGTVVKLDEKDNILNFISKKDFRFEEIPDYYKTVNIYKFSRTFSRTHYVPFLEAYSKALGNNEYYEQVLKIITLLERPEIKALRLSDETWYEIDDVQDLDIAESMFTTDRYEKLAKFQSRFGGYWRYPHLLDFCYLVNPFFPSPKLVAEIKANFERLLFNYPSGMQVNSLLAAKYFGLHRERVVVGNGAAELIKALVEDSEGNLGCVFPTFEEYPNRKAGQQILPFVPKGPDFTYTAQDLLDYFADRQISTLVLINPDNPSGNYIPRAEVLRLAGAMEERGVRLILDESFVDFAEEEDATLLCEELLAKHPSMVVVKSISKSYGVPGLRLGIAASADEGLIVRLKRQVAIWNVNSFGEFYMQIFEKYKSEYQASLSLFKQERARFFADLAALPGLRPIPSQANYILCELTGGVCARDLAADLLEEEQILIKDLSTKRGFDGREYIRLAVRDEADDRALVRALARRLGAQN